LRYSSIQVGKQDAGKRLDVFLAGKFSRTRSAVRAKLEGDVLTEDGRKLKWSHRLRAGEVIRVATQVHPEPQVQVTYRQLHQDEWILAVDKGPGAPVHPVRTFRTRTLLTRLRADLNEPGLKPAHRLDRETSGVLVFARTPRALTALMNQFKDGRVSKKYLAIVRGAPDFDQKIVDLPLGRDPDFPVRCRMRPGSGRPAQTEFTVLQRHKDRALVSAVPRTGRQHQIRVHLAALGHPVLGDKLYQEDGRPYLAMIKDRLDDETIERLGHHRHALHAESLQIQHPQTGKQLRIRAELPDDLEGLLG
jgi:23S rRNA pseudouridine1911/1915/1917 synthase